MNEITPTPCPLTVAAERINPQADQNLAQLNAEIEGLYHFITTRYTVAFDMLVVLMSVATTIGYEAFAVEASTQELRTPKETMQRLLNDMIEQYQENQRKRVH